MIITNRRRTADARLRISRGLMECVQVSTILAVYNGAYTVGRAIESALAQQFPGITEVVVVDDGSTDATSALLNAFGDRIKVIRQRNYGLAAARNRGVAAAAGDYIAFLDADDIWLPDRLAKTVTPLLANPDLVLAYSDLVPTDEDGTELAPGYVRPGVAHAPSMDEMLRQWWPILPSTVTMRRATFDRCGGFCEEFKGAGGFDDIYLWMMAREFGQFHYVAEPLVRYRLTPFTQRMFKYAPGFRIFAGRVRQHWGSRGAALVRRSARSYAWLLTMRAARHLADQDRAAAQRAMLCAFRYRPRFDAALRLLITMAGRADAQKMIASFLRHPRTPIDREILCGAIPVDLR
jgi:glycosyltransferase involved in cell wall biosynthesis